MRDRSEQLYAEQEKKSGCMSEPDERNKWYDCRFESAFQHLQRTKTYEKKIEELKEKYKEAEHHNKKHMEYEKTAEFFLMLRQVFFASELGEGMPCLVCGSTEHPRPCVMKKEHLEFTREGMDLLEKETEKLRSGNRKICQQR